MYSNKKEFDKFYTKESVAIECIKLIDPSRYDFIIEPSVGSGNFYNNITHNNKIGLDIEPDSDIFKKQDWFNYQIPERYKSVLVFGNPPFGKRNKLSSSFIRHATSFDNVATIAFILPDVYNKHTLQKHVPDIYKLSTIYKLPKNSFTLDGNDYDIPCSFFIFDVKSNVCLRFNPAEFKETASWQYGTPKDYNFFVMGASLNTIKDKPESTNRGYYIKVKSGHNIQMVKDNFRNAKWIGYSGASGGVSWFTKPEVVKEYIRIFE